MLLFLILVLSLITPIVHAEDWVCSDTSSMRVIKRVQGDCLKLGLCLGFDNTNIKPGCIDATAQEYQKAAETYVKYDPLSPIGSRIVDMSADEISAAVLQQQNIQRQEDTDAVNNIKVTVAEAFTSFIKVYNSKMPAAQRISKQELIDQIKSDKGL